MRGSRFNGGIGKAILGVAAGLLPASVSFGQTTASGPVIIRGGESNYLIVIPSTQRSPSPYAFTGEDPNAQSRQQWEKQVGPIFESVNGVPVDLGSPR